MRWRYEEEWEVVPLGGDRKERNRGTNMVGGAEIVEEKGCGSGITINDPVCCQPVLKLFRFAFQAVTRF